jgi:hypothetical protein
MITLLYMILSFVNIINGQLIYEHFYDGTYYGVCSNPFSYNYIIMNKCYQAPSTNNYINCNLYSDCSGLEFEDFYICVNSTFEGFIKFNYLNNILTAINYNTNCELEYSRGPMIMDCRNSYNCYSQLSHKYTTEQYISNSCVDLEDNNCSKQHSDKKGPCLSILIMNHRLNKTTEIKATQDHVILQDNKWMLVRELHVGMTLNNGIIINIKSIICHHLNSCISPGFTFNHLNETFGTMSLITPNDLYKIPNWIYRLLKIWINLPM